MTEPVSLAQHRWARGDEDAASYNPCDILDVAMAKIKSGELDLDHIAVCYACKDGTVGLMQGGSYDSYGQIGLLEHLKWLILDL